MCARFFVTLGCLAGLLTFSGGRAADVARVPARPVAVFDPADDAFLEELQRASFRFFAEQAHPLTGLVSDKSSADGGPLTGKASIACSGYALAGWVIATERRWVERPVALERTRSMLRFLLEKAPRRHGFFFHFMEPDTGERAWECELSTIDTSLFLAGAIVAREYFADPAITAMVDRLYGDIEWSTFRNGGNTLTSSWRPEIGYSRFRWASYSEHMVMSLLTLGSPTHPFPAEYWHAWKREPLISYGGRNYLQGAPLFVHQFSHAYVDFRDQRDAYADYFRNSSLATLAQRQFCIDLRSEFPTWGERLWGVTASESSRGYIAWGGPPRTREGGALDGTIVPCAAGGSIPFAPAETLQTLRHMREAFGSRVWRRYGFVHAFNPENVWTAPDVLGIDAGITLVQAENARTGLIWSLFTQAPEIQRALAKAGFVSTHRKLELFQQEPLRRLAAEQWKILADAPIERESGGLQLTAMLAAHALGLITSSEALAAARDMLATAKQPVTATGIAHYAAGLVTLRQALPDTAEESSRRLAELRWAEVGPISPLLGAGSRLVVFFQIAAGARPASTWAALERKPVAHGPIHVLAPARAGDQLLPGLWLDEREIISGASAAQFAHVQATSSADAVSDPLATALVVQHFPRAVIARLPLPDTLRAASLADRAALFIALANALADDCVRRWFQNDSFVRAGREAIAEFGEAAFGQNTSVFTRRELAGPRPMPPQRRVIARSNQVPSEKWDWQTVAGMDYRESAADIRPGDPAISLRFTFSWDAEALHFHGEANDTPAGYERPPRRREVVELHLDPQGDGFDWTASRDHQYTFMSNGRARDGMREEPIPADIRPTQQGYTVKAAIPWNRLGLTPRGGLKLGASASIFVGGPRNNYPSLKLTWRHHRDEDGRGELGTLVLEP